MSKASDSETGRDLRVAGGVGAAIRMGLSEIVQRLAASTPLSTSQAFDHVQYEMNVLKGNYAKKESGDVK